MTRRRLLQPRSAQHPPSRGREPNQKPEISLTAATMADGGGRIEVIAHTKK